MTLTKRSQLQKDIDSLPIGKYQKKPTLILKFEGRSKSGLTRWYNVYAITEYNELIRLSHSVNEVYKEQDNSNRYDNKREALKVKGCGFDGAFHIVYDIGSMLYGDGYYLDYRTI